jgi:glucan biosynthesis protein C
MQSQIVPGQTDRASRASMRLHYLDTLRVLAVFMVFLFHSSRAFTTVDWLVMNAEKSTVATAFFLAFLAPWGMPFFFLLAGAGTWFALQRRSARQFAAERFKRLLVPYLVGCALFTPLQAYFDWQFSMREDGFTGSYLQFLMVDRWSGWNPTISDWLGYHLWFLAFLFAFSLVALPLLQWLKGASGRGLVSRLAGLSQRRGGILAFILPLVAIQLILRPLSPVEHSWSDLLYDLAFFLSGYLFYADERFLRAIRRNRWLVLVLGIAALLGILAMLALGEAETLFSTPGSLAYSLFWALAVIDAWCWSLTMLYVGMRFLDFSNRWTRYGQQAVVPFYLLHQPVIVAIAFYVVQWDTGVTVKMVAVVIGSLAVTLGIYELLVRRVAPLRAMFGMKAVTKPLAAQPQEATPISHSETQPSA